MDTKTIEERGIRELQQLHQTQERLIKAHAAESLLKLGQSEGVYDAFLKEWEAHQKTPPYRVVVMRVLSRASKTPAERDVWSKRIRDVFVDTKQPDRLHAIECLAKLGYHVEPADQEFFEEAAAGDDPQIAIFALWTLGSKDFRPRESAIVEYLKSPDHKARYTAAYTLRHVPKLSDDAKAAIRTAARAEKPGTLAYAYLNCASFVVSMPGDRDESARSRGVLAKLAEKGDHDESREIAAVLGICGTIDDFPILDELLTSRDPDVREAVAQARVAIVRRMPKI